MRTHPDGTHRYKVTFKGGGSAYVDHSTKRLLSIGAKWFMLIGIPVGVLCAMLVSKGPWIGFLAGYAGGGIIGWTGGVIYASLTKEKPLVKEVKTQVEMKQNFGNWWHK